MIRASLSPSVASLAASTSSPQGVPLPPDSQRRQGRRGVHEPRVPPRTRTSCGPRRSERAPSSEVGGTGAAGEAERTDERADERTSEGANETRRLFTIHASTVTTTTTTAAGEIE
eukprot:30237-Pelagococcus_subviridis.AAC.4